MFRAIFNKTAHTRLIIALVMISVAVIIGCFVTRTINESKYVDHVNRVLKEKSDIIDKELQTLVQIPDDDLFTGIPCKYYRFQGIEYLLYKNDTLVFWSDNLNAASYIYDSVLFSSNLVELGNGYYYKRELIRNEKIYLGLLLVRKNYKYENEYITNDFNTCFSLPQNTSISLTENGNDIKNDDGVYLFSLNFPDKRVINENCQILLLFIYLTSLLFLISSLFHLYQGFRKIYSYSDWFFLFFVVDVIIIRALTFYFRIPRILYESKLFSPSHLAISKILPSFGDLFVNVVIVFLLIYYFFTYYKFGFKANINTVYKKLTAFILLLSVYIFFRLFQGLFYKIVIDSTISFNLGNIFSLDLISLLGFIALGLIVISYFLLGIKLSQTALELSGDKPLYILLSVITAMVFSMLTLIRNDFQIIPPVFVFLFVNSFALWSKKEDKLFDTARIVIYLFAFTFITTLDLQLLNQYKEKQERKLIAMELASNRDEIVEFKFKQIEREIYNDTILQALIREAYLKPENEKKVISYMLDKYFNVSFSKFDIQITICFPDKQLYVKSQDYIIDCNTFFENYVETYGEETDSEILYYIFPGINYFAHLKFPEKAASGMGTASVFIEISAKAIEKGLGYPELLIDKAYKKPYDLFNYSYATYMDGELVRSVGKYSYAIKETEMPVNKDNFTFFDHQDHNHLVYYSDSNTNIIVSLPKPSFLNIVAPYSYFLIFLGLLSFILSMIIKIRNRAALRFVSFRYRIQFLMFGIILVSYLVIGISVLVYIVRLNDNKNFNALREKNHSVLVELENKLSSYDEFDKNDSEYLNDLLINSSMIFFSDINLYNPKGILISSSRPQVFEEGLVSDRMNPEAFRQLAIYNKSSFIHRESIGSYKYLSAYMPFHNDNYQITGYLNLPYFAKQSELRQEISTFLVTFTNIYVVLMALGLFFALLLSGYLLRPLMLLKANLQKLKLSESTQKIEWKGNDEISELIGEYNRMTEELVKSAELLARSERESAWREMAKQVAHEIKNPLTPMKLSVQYLQKAWNDNAPDWNERLERFSQTLIQQIDSLSEIASAFSDFASMPAATKTKINLDEVINDAASLYKGIQNIRIIISSPEKESDSFIIADKRQLLRVFNNLIHNSVQAIGNKPDGMVQIRLKKENNYLIAEIQDNGSGMNDEQRAKVFSPYFTTKSSGMGLGLAIVKNIVSGMGGSIEFVSEENRGTIFTLRFPITDNL